MGGCVFGGSDRLALLRQSVRFGESALTERPSRRGRRIASALVSPEGHAAIQRLLSASDAKQGLAYASQEEYTGLDVYLKDSRGYSR